MTEKKISGLKISLSFLFIFIAASCTSTNNFAAQGTAVKPKTYSSVDDEPFYAQNCNSFFEDKLSNGIPVVIKKSKYQKNCSLALLIDSDEIPDKEKKSGLEEITLELMKLGTSDYSSLYISSLEYTDSTKFTSSVHSDFMQYAIVFPKERISAVIPVFAQTYKKPLLSLEGFEEILRQKKNSYGDADKKEQVKILQKIYEVLNGTYGGFVPEFYTENSLITYKDVVNCHARLLNAGRIKIVASGNFNDDEVQLLFKVLNENFGNLKSFAFSKKKTSEKKIIASDFESAKLNFVDPELKQDYSFGIYSIPKPLSINYYNYAVCSLFLDDMLYGYVKEMNNFAEDAGTGTLTGWNNVGIISVYNVRILNNLNEGVQDFILSNFKIETIKKKLDFYKRIYISSVMSAELSSAETVRQMALSLVYSGEAKKYIERPFIIQQITAEEVERSFVEIMSSGIVWLNFINE
ncbi:MAG: insulinase family protein [Treponema sp.]